MKLSCQDNSIYGYKAHNFAHNEINVINIKGVAERKQKLSAFASEFFYEQLFALFCFEFVVVVIKRVALFT